jgi:NAD(P)-dependent dehydrogenase (short-subunit alcohol dehydrogenase family)
MSTARPLAIVTGGTRGIGRATSVALARDGWDLVVAYRSNDAAAHDTTADCEALGASCVTVCADMTSEADIVALFTKADELGPLRALINNAGIVAPKARVDEYTAERMRNLFEVNTIGPMLCAREAVRRMSTRHGGEGGRIVNVSSAAARLGSPGEYVDYAASKGAIDTFTVGLAKEVAEEGILVNGVRPGIIDTDIHASGGQPDRAQRLAHLVPLQRPGTAEEIAATIVFLCSDGASYLCGSIIDVAGGR